MHPRITLLTLAVDDLERAVAFYRDGLGLPTRGIVGTDLDHGAVAFFELEGGLGLALWPRSSLEHDTGLPARRTDGTTSIIAHNVRSRDRVVAVLEEARAAGATILKEAQDTFWGGYAGYFQDQDGHLWEIAWNPQMMPPV